MGIVINNLEFGYTEDKILKNISCEIPAGKCISVLGPNGAGKSTFIKCLNGLLTPQKGSVKLNNKSIQKMSRKEIAKKIGYVPQSIDNLFPLSVFDMVLLGRKSHASWRNSKVDFDKVIESLSLLNIQHLAMKNFGELSGGQQQKVVIARALCQEAEVLLLDEAVSNLDIRHQLEVMEVVNKLVYELGVTVIMIVHDLNIAARYSDYIILMKDGRLIKRGIPEKVLTEENILSVYEVESIVSNVGGSSCILPIKIKEVKENERIYEVC